MKRTIATALVTMAMIAACSSSKAPTAPSSTVGPSTTAVQTSTVSPTMATSTAPITTTTDTEAPTTVMPVTTVATPTTLAVQLLPILQDLMTRHDAAVAAILEDPRVAADASNQKVVAFVALFPPDSSFAAGSLKFWSQEGERGRFYRPGPGGSISNTTVQKVSSSSDTEATFTVCSVSSIKIVDASGSVIEAQGGVSAGTVVAVKVDANWLLRDLSEGSNDVCPKPGSSG